MLSFVNSEGKAVVKFKGMEEWRNGGMEDWGDGGVEKRKAGSYQTLTSRTDAFSDDAFAIW